MREISSAPRPSPKTSRASEGPRAAPSRPESDREPSSRLPGHPAPASASASRQGVRVDDLLTDDRAQWTTARGLEAWLLASGFAQRDGGPGLLVPTPLGRDVGEALSMLP